MQGRSSLVFLQTCVIFGFYFILLDSSFQLLRDVDETPAGSDTEPSNAALPALLTFHQIRATENHCKRGGLWQGDVCTVGNTTSS